MKISANQGELPSGGIEFDGALDNEHFSLLKAVEDDLKGMLSGLWGVPDYQVALVREVEPRPYVAVTFNGAWNPTIALPTNSCGLEVRYSERRGS